MTADISIVGLGVCNVDHITRQVERAVGRAREVLYVDTGPATRAWLAGRCSALTDLYAESYRVGGVRADAYRHMAVRTVEAALDHAPVCFAMFGHPTVGAQAPSLIASMARELSLTVEVLPGVSAMAALFADLLLDPCARGLQMYEATDLLLRARPLQPDVPALIWQVGNLETRLHTDRASRPERFDRFVRHLRATYPADHEITLYFASPHPMMRAQVPRVRLADLRAHAHRLHHGVTLYIPPVGIRPIADPHLAAVVDDPEHLGRHTRSS